MTRQEENKELVDLMINKAEEKDADTFENLVVFQLGLIGTMLADISKSLAIIADSVAKEEGE